MVGSRRVFVLFLILGRRADHPMIFHIFSISFLPQVFGQQLFKVLRKTDGIHCSDKRSLRTDEKKKKTSKQNIKFHPGVYMISTINPSPSRLSAGKSLGIKILYTYSTGFMRFSFRGNKKKNPVAFLMLLAKPSLRPFQTRAVWSLSLFLSFSLSLSLSLSYPVTTKQPTESMTSQSKVSATTYQVKSQKPEVSTHGTSPHIVNTPSGESSREKFEGKRNFILKLVVLARHPWGSYVYLQ